MWKDILTRTLAQVEKTAYKNVLTGAKIKIVAKLTHSKWIGNSVG